MPLENPPLDSWPDEDGVFDRMLVRLKALDTASGKKPRYPANQLRDILIAETAVKNGLTLVSDDVNLRCVTTEFGGNAITLPELRTRIPRSSWVLGLSRAIEYV